MSSDQVRAWYNQVERSLESRNNSCILNVRNFNNWIKAKLIDTYCPTRARVLDLCGGKGGDLAKYAHARIAALTLCDIAEASVHEAEKRYRGRVYRFAADFLVADCFAPDFKPTSETFATPADFVAPTHFDLISCQFALHYAFESRERAEAAFKHAALLKRGAYWIATVLDDAVLRSRLSRCGEFGNNLYRVRLASTDGRERQSCGALAPFGVRYDFYLADAVDVPEYLVQLHIVEALAQEHNLELVDTRNFHEFYAQEKDTLLHRMGADKAPQDALAWEVIGLYRVLVFRKL